MLQHVNHGCGENRTGQTAVYIYLILVICLICSYYILGEKLTVWSASGAFLVLFGLVLSQLDSSVLKKKFLKA
ncbi:EamA family transporter [Parasutterella excrementihominis]|uniref:EamA family transporter n=1 Tax=Parasutterella excrementihominis TaxID=487175 RepID=UPI003461985D